MRVKTVWTVTGPITDPESGEIIETTVMQGSVTGDRLAAALSDIESSIAALAQETGVSTDAYTLTIAKEAD